MSLSLRPLGRIESLMTLVHAGLAGSSQGLQALRLAGTIDFARLKEAACIVFQKHEGLRCRILEQDGALHFFSQDDFSAIPVRQAVLASDDDWDSVLDNELHDVIDPNCALWRLTCVTGPVDGRGGVLLSYHHAIMDGAAVHAILDDLLGTLDRLMSGEGAKLESEPMPKAVDTYLLPTSAGNRADDHRPGEPIDHMHAVPLEERRTRYLRTTIAPAQNRALKERCREDGIQPNSLISAALSLAMVQAGVARSPVPFKSAVSLRKLPGSTQAVMGCYLAVADTPLVIENESLAELARRYEKSLMDAVTRHCIRAGAFDISAAHRYVQRVRDGNRFDAFGVTNLGEINLELSYRHFTIEDYIPLANRVAGNQALALHVSEFGAALDLFFVYPEPAMSRNCIRLLQSMFENFLVRYMGERQGNAVAAAG